MVIVLIRQHLQFQHHHLLILNNETQGMIGTIEILKGVDADKVGPQTTIKTIN
jgi:hypothetical protein